MIILTRNYYRDNFYVKYNGWVIIIYISHYRSYCDRYNHNTDIECEF